MSANAHVILVSSSAAVVVPQQTAGQTQQPSEAQLQSQLRQAEQEVRKAALENARTQLEQQRAQLEAQQHGQRVVVTPGPGIPRITITRDGQPSVVVGGGAGPGTAGTGSPEGLPPFDIPHGAVVLGLAFFFMLAFIAVGLPIARAIARRMDRRSTVSPAAAPVPSDVTDRLERIEHAVESIAIEVERISEGQRFTTKLLADRGEVPAAAALSAPRPDQFAGGGR